MKNIPVRVDPYFQRMLLSRLSREYLGDDVTKWDDCSYSIDLGNKNWCYFYSYQNGLTTTVIQLDSEIIFTQDNYYKSAKEFAMEYIKGK